MLTAGVPVGPVPAVQVLEVRGPAALALPCLSRLGLPDLCEDSLAVVGHSSFGFGFGFNESIR